MHIKLFVNIARTEPGKFSMLNEGATNKINK